MPDASASVTCARHGPAEPGAAGRHVRRVAASHARRGAGLSQRPVRQCAAERRGLRGSASRGPQISGTSVWPSGRRRAPPGVYLDAFAAAVRSRWAWTVSPPPGVAETETSNAHRVPSGAVATRSARWNASSPVRTTCSVSQRHTALLMRVAQASRTTLWPTFAAGRKHSCGRERHGGPELRSMPFRWREGDRHSVGLVQRQASQDA